MDAKTQTAIENLDCAMQRLVRNEATMQAVVAALADKLVALLDWQRRAVDELRNTQWQSEDAALAGTCPCCCGNYLTHYEGCERIALLREAL